MANIGDKKITHIYQGDKLVSEDNQDTQYIKFGNKNIDFVFQGNNILYPNPINHNLVVWYDFKGLTNESFNKDIANDLTNNSNGSLKNFSYSSGSGYNNGLLFDGIDDYISTLVNIDGFGATFSFSIDVESNTGSFYIMSGESLYVFIRKNGNNLDISLLNSSGKQELFSLINFFLNNIGKQSITILIDATNKKVKFYKNGGLLKTFEMSSDAKMNMKIDKIGRSSMNSGYFYKGKLYSLKIYDKPLSDEEILHNYNLEKERWNL